MAQRKIAWLAAGGVVLVCAAVAAISLHRGGNLSLPHGSEIIAGVAALGTFGWLAFAGLQIVVSLSGVLPASALGVAAGSIYGTGLGFTVSAASTLAGAGFAFGLSRSVLRPWIERRMRDRQNLRRIDAAIQREGWRLACLVRLSPVMPFAATSYMLGLSSISLRDYCIGTLGSLPALFGYVVIGALAGAGVHDTSGGASAIRLVLLGAGILATGLVTIRIGRIVAAVTGWRSSELDMTPTDAATTSQPASST
ncbi:MAG TPA: TVP38/TMEM64 family protein [Rhodopila sp.]